MTTPADTDEISLPSFSVLARYAVQAPDEAAATAALGERLAEQRGLWNDLLVERREPDGTWLVLARFVVVSLDAHTAVSGVHDTLVQAGVTPDEVWAAADLA